jgi:hypothetical protein
VLQRDGSRKGLSEAVRPGARDLDVLWLEGDISLMARQFHCGKVNWPVTLANTTTLCRAPRSFLLAYSASLESTKICCVL